MRAVRARVKGNFEENMKNSIIITSILAISTAAFSACGGGTNTVPNKPEAKPSVTSTPAVTPPLTPAASPSVDPKASPAKPGTTPEAKKDDKKPAVNKDGRIVPKETPKK